MFVWFVFSYQDLGYAESACEEVKASAVGLDAGSDSSG